MKEFITREEAPDYFPIKSSRLAKLAHERIGPKYRLIGGTAIYRARDIETWLLKQPALPRTKGRPNKKRSSNTGELS